MKLLWAFLVVCALGVQGYPYPYPYYGSNSFDTISYGSSDSRRGGMVMSRYYNPYYPRTIGSMAAFMYKPEEQYQPQYQPQSSQYYVPDKRQTDAYVPQQNEVYYPQVPEQIPEKPVYSEPVPELPAVTEATELADPTQKVELPTTTLKTLVTPEITEPETEEVAKPVLTPKKRVTKKKQVKNPEDEDQEEGSDYPPSMPSGAYFPMFFGYGRAGGAPGGATAIANAFSTGRGGVATSHATAYGPPRPEFRSSA